MSLLRAFATPSMLSLPLAYGIRTLPAAGSKPFRICGKMVASRYCSVPSKALHAPCASSGKVCVIVCNKTPEARRLTAHCTGTFHEFGTPEYDELIPPENRRPGSRAAIVIDVYRVGTVRFL